MAENRLTRRDFVRQTAGMVAGATLAGAAARRADARADTRTILNYNPRMGYRRFGRTAVMLSEIGLGGHWKTPSGGRYWASFPNDDPPPAVQKNRNDVWAKCAEAGINYLDITTAGEAAIYGRCMKQTGIPFHVGYSDHVLCIRNPENRTVEKMMLEIDEGLRRLMIERIWLWRPQALMGGGHTDAEIERVVETYEKARKQGKVEHLGMSAHNHDFVRQVLEKLGNHFHGFVFMYSVSHERKDSAGMFDVIRSRDCGAIGLRPFHGNSYFAKIVREARNAGRQPDLDGQAIQGLKKILEVPELTCTIPGLTTVAEVENDVKASYEREKPLTAAERDDVRRLAAASLEDLTHDDAPFRGTVNV